MSQDASSSKQPEFIRLMDAQRVVVLDSVATEYEDSFCLESFGDLIKAAEESVTPTGSKHFIIARVQTWDHKQPDRAFYSYYHAHHLNKILFQTQIYLTKKLIHRLHVLNPLTNTDIIGNVLYFMVVGKTVVRKPLEGVDSLPGSHTVPSSITTGVKQTAALETQTNPPLKINTNMNEVKISDTVVPPSPSVSKLPVGILDPMVLNRTIHNRSPDRVLPEVILEEREDEDELQSPKTAPSLKQRQEDAEANTQGWTLTGAVTDLGDQEPATEKRQQPNDRRRSSIRQIALNVTRKLSMVGPRPQGFTHIGDEEKSAVDAANGGSLKINTKFARQQGAPVSASIVEWVSAGSTEPSLDKSVFSFTAAKPTADTIYAQTPISAPPQRLQKMIPAGQITQRGKALTPIQAMAVVPPTRRQRRRSISYLNAMAATGSTHASIEDWKSMVRQHRQQPKGDESLASAAGDFDLVNPFEHASLSPVAEKPAVHGVPAESLKSTVSGGDEEVFYDAVLIATDNDFLETSRVRALFRENAVQSADAVLFEMPPYTGEPERDPRPEFADAPLPCDWCCPTDEELRAANRATRFFHSVKCYIFVIIITAVVVSVIAMAAQNESQYSSTKKGTAATSNLESS